MIFVKIFSLHFHFFDQSFILPPFVVVSLKLHDLQSGILKLSIKISQNSQSILAYRKYLKYLNIRKDITKITYYRDQVCY